MSRVVTSADIDALNRTILQQGQELFQTNERVARLEAQVRELQDSFKALEENLIGPDPHVRVLEMPGAPASSPIGITPATPVQPLIASYGADLHENVITREALLALGAGQQEAEVGPDAEDGPEFEGFAERAGRDPESFLSDGGPVTNSAPVADAGVSVGGE